jgi:hypothetical protein
MAGPFKSSAVIEVRIRGFTQVIASTTMSEPLSVAYMNRGIAKAMTEDARLRRNLAYARRSSWSHELSDVAEFHITLVGVATHS